ncbi:MAG: hypothetical protein IPJ87_17140 [Flavobacteriales bacterium]|nr:hypothetical protein [Flavobacteriales bacterium]MBK7943571.1 hypothetical protein [Flavobacteriales bacterium]MBK9699743.1 hypothetical protein [Flavobacteriales bacterium]
MTSFRILSLICAALGGQLTHGQWSVVDTSGSVVINAICHYPTSGAFALSSDFYKSLDQGDTWTYWTPTQGGFPMIAVWKDGYFTSSTHGLVAGAFDLDNQYAVIGTPNGGVAWTTRYASYAGAWPRRLNAMVFPSLSVGYAVGTNGRVIRTLDGGANWNSIPSGTNTELTSAFFWSDDAGIIAGNGVLLRTTNGGAAWTPALAVVGEHHVAGGTDGTLDTCGPGPLASLNGTVTALPVILQQPQSLTVNVGDPFTLEVVTTGTTNASQWFHNGLSVGPISFTYSVAQATLADTGEYYWQQWLGSACGYLTSDTAFVTVSGSVGMEEGTTMGEALQVRPNPSNGTIMVELPAFPDERRLSAVDAHGRTVHQARYPGGPARLVELSLHHLESGAYRILLQGSDRLRSATVLISH